MSEYPLFFSESIVELVSADASDIQVAAAAQVSQGRTPNDDTDVERLIKALVRLRHGSPFEHNKFTFRVTVPIFIAREWQRHRIGSFNEVSGRYTKLEGHFYIPKANQRGGLANSGTSMVPKRDHLAIYTELDVEDQMRMMSIQSWSLYEDLINDGVANEVARMILPLNTFTSFYWTINARSLMNFLSLRVHDENARDISYPQYEIEQPAKMVEEYFAEAMPFTHAAFVANGRVAP
jgi:thymidylate synthase (FAD)